MEKEVEKTANEIFPNSLDEKISQVAEEFLKLQKEKEIQVVSHFDTDGITAASIIVKCLKRLDMKFSTLIVKTLDSKAISKLSPDRTVLFTDLASNSLESLGNFKKVFIIDHHEVTQSVPENVTIINPQLHGNKDETSSSALCYLFAKRINPVNKDLAPLAVIGMIGDSVKNISISNNEITKDADIVVKKGVLLYPSTRPINRVLEFSAEPYIPSVTGNKEGVFQMLKEIGFERQNGEYKSLIELTEEEMTKIATAILLRRVEKNNEDLIGNIFLVKHFNQLEDAREVSAKINASSRLGEPHTSVLYCLGDSRAKKQVEKLYARYRQMIINGLNSIGDIEKIKGEGYVVINAKSLIEDSIISVITTILSKSSLYEEGTVIIAMTNSGEDKIKVSGRTVGKGRSVREIFERVMPDFEGEFGGHKYAAGCMLNVSRENEFIERVKKELEIELVKV